MFKYFVLVLFVAVMILSVYHPARVFSNTRSSDVYDTRMADWRNHQVVYQVFVDRFATDGDPQKRAELYSSPRKLRPWNAQPTEGKYLSDIGNASHELEFWGGTLKGLIGKLDYIKSLGVNTLYLNPIFLSYTNHKYDAIDYFSIDPQYGTRQDFEELCNKAHKLGLKVILDGVFNHTGRRSEWFQQALKDPSSKYRNFYTFDSKLKSGYLGWNGVENLPELNYNNPAVKDVIYRSPNSVVQSYLAVVDGWRLDVAFDLGPQILSELTQSAHKAKADSYTVGEIYNYPAGWSPSLDGVMNMYMSRLLIELTQGKISARKAADMLDVLIQDGGLEPLLKSWIVLSNHDRSRLKTVFPELKDREFITALQISLPGAPLVYYGEEIGLNGEKDPEQRGPMNWEVVESNSAPELNLTKKLLNIRNTNPALQVGDYLRIPTEQLFAFTRRTSSVRETVVVVANPTDKEVTETITPRDPWLMDVQKMRDLLGGSEVEIGAGMISVTIAPKTVKILVPTINQGSGYSPYKHVD